MRPVTNEIVTLWPVRPIIGFPPSPLIFTWTFYVHWSDYYRTWSQSFRPIAVFSSKEWANTYFDCYGNLKTLPQGWTLSLFKLGIRPEWEDRANHGGGRWIADLPTDEENSLFSVRWASLFRSIVFDKFGYTTDVICGISYHDRPLSTDKICLWIRGGLSASSIIQLGLCFKDALMYSPARTVVYRQHNTASDARLTRYQKNLYYL